MEAVLRDPAEKSGWNRAETEKNGRTVRPEGTPDQRIRKICRLFENMFLCYRNMTAADYTVSSS